jgi:hypothetical protein
MFYQDNSFGIVTRLWAGGFNRVSIPGRVKKYSFYSKFPGRFQDLSSLSPSGDLGYIAGGKEPRFGTDYSP